MMKTMATALVLVLATLAPPPAMAHSHSAHSHLTGSHVTRTLRGPGYARTDPVRDPGYARTESVGPNWGSECVTDEGQGRFLPCDGGP